MSNDRTNRASDGSGNERDEGAWGLLFLAWRQKWLLILGVVCGLGLGYLYFLKEIPVFQSTAQILIARERAKLPIEGLEVTTNYDSTHEVVLTSPMVLKLAVEKHKLRSLPSISNSSNPVAYIRAGLAAKGNAADKQSDIVKLTYSSTDPSECPIVLDAVIDAYQDFLGDTYKNVSNEAIDLISQAKLQLEQQISESAQKYREFRANAELLFSGQSASNIHESRLQEIETVRSEAERENSKIQARIDALEAALKRGGSREALNLVVGQLKQDQSIGQVNSSGEVVPNPAGTTVEEQLFPLMLEEQTLLDSFGPDHPKVKAVRNRIDLMRRHLLGMKDKNDARETVTKPRDFYEVYLQSLQVLIEINKQTIDEMDKLFEKERESAKLLANDQVTDTTLRDDLERKGRLFDAVVKRLEEINLVKDTGTARIQPITPPGSAEQIKPKFQSVMTMAGLLGLAVGFGLGFLVDSADRRFRSPEEIRMELGVPVIGHIPVIAEDRKAKKVPAESPLSPTLRTFFHPRGRIAEAYRAVRTSLYFNNRSSNHQVIQVTSPSPADGKTTLAANTAVSIALSGKRVIIVDCDFRRPRLHRMFGVSNDVGMSSVIDGSAELSDAIKSTPIENLSLMVCGPRPKNPAELLTSKRFEELLSLLREKFDIVIVDTPPVLVVTDALNVAPRVDVVLLVLRLTKSARGAGRRALEALEEVGGNCMGIVVNGVGPVGSGYGYGYGGRYGSGYGYGYKGGYGAKYGGYGYGDGYGSGYGSTGYGGYGYRYGYGDDRVYYEDDKEDTSRSVVKVVETNGNGKA